MRRLSFVFFTCMLLYSTIGFAGINFSSRSSKILVENSSILKFGNAVSLWDGTLEKVDGGSIVGSSVTFDKGILDDAETGLKLTADYDPGALRKITLGGSQKFRAVSGTVLDKITVSGSGNRIEGQPLFSNSDSITLSDLNTDVVFAIQSDLNSDIELNGGVVKLENDFKFADQRLLNGTGTVELQGHGFSFGGKDLTLTHTVEWNHATDVTLQGRTNLSGTWKFVGDSKLQGNGNVIDFSSAGAITIAPDTTLEMTDVVLKGLGTNGGSLIFQNNSSHIKMSNVTIELDNDLTTTLGGVYVEGPTTVVAKNYDWTFEQNASLTVDGISLWLDGADQEGLSYQGKIKFGSGQVDKYLDYVSNGTIKTTISDYSVSNLEIDVTNNSNAVVHILDYDVNNNSNAILRLDEKVVDNSNAIAQLDIDVQTNSTLMWQNSRETLRLWNFVLGDFVLPGWWTDYEALADIVADNRDLSFANSRVVQGFDSIIKGGSNAIVTMDREFEQSITNNSNAIVTIQSDHQEQITNNSNALVTMQTDLLERVENNSNATVTMHSDYQQQITNNSNTIVMHDGEITSNASSISTNAGNISSNAGAISTNAGNISSNAGAISTNAGNISSNAGAISTNAGNISTNESNITANDADIKENSNAIITMQSDLQEQITNNSNSILWDFELKRQHSNAIVTMQTDLQKQVTNNSNAIINLPTVDLQEQITNNSNAIIRHDGELDLMYENSNGIVSIDQDAIRGNSIAVISLTSRVTTNEGDITTNAGNISSNAGAISTNAGNISSNAGAISTNAGNISTNAGNISTNAGNITANAADIEENSNAIITMQVDHQEQITNNSNSILWDFELKRQHSNAIVHLLDHDINNNSNAIITVQSDHQEQITNNSNALVTMQTDLLERVENSSNAIITMQVDHQEQITNNSNSILWDFELKRQHSNAIVHLLDHDINNNSNAIITVQSDHQEQITNNSNALVTIQTDLLERVENSSNAIVTMQLDHQEQITNNSNAVVHMLDYDVNNNSNAILRLDEKVVDNSNAIAQLDIDVQTNSTLMWQNSRETLRLWNFVLGDFVLPGWWTDYEALADIVADNRDLSFANSRVVQGFDSIIKGGSNAIVTMDREFEQSITNNSNAIVTIQSDHQEQITNNSNALVTMQTDLLERVENNSNATVTMQTDLQQQITNNSNAIATFDVDFDLIYYNSKAIVSVDQDAIRGNSIAVISLTSRVTTNEGDITTNAGNISSNAGAISTNAGNISGNAGAISTNAGNISTNAGNITANAADIEENSNAIITMQVDHQEQITNNSNSILWDFELKRQHSNAIVHLLDHDINNNSNAIITVQSDHQEQITNNSNAILSVPSIDLQEQITNNSNAILWDFELKRQHSNAIVTMQTDLLDRIESNSNVLVMHDGEITSNAGSISTNAGNISSNAGAISTNAGNISGNAGAISTNAGNISTNAGNITANAADIEENSNAIITMQVDHQEQITNNSNSILWDFELKRQHSNAIVTMQTDLLERVENNSNALISTQVDLQQQITNNSNAFVTLEGLEDGIKMIAYKDSHHVFHDGDIATGFVKYNKGFTILPSEVATLNINEAISEVIDLRHSGGLRLKGDLFLSSGMTFSAGGKIGGQGNTIFLNGNITVPSDSVLTFTSDTIINGQGNDLTLDRWSQLFVDTGVTLTLKNVILKNNRNSQGFPPIMLASQDSKLALDDVKICSAQDFYFKQGQLFIHNDVVFTGTSRFVYRSSQPSLITSHAMWYFEPNTTFFYDSVSTFSPSATLSTNNNMYLRNNELIRMIDDSSALYLNQCTFKISHSGLRLTKGQVFCDNKVIIKNNEKSYVSTFGFAAGITHGSSVSHLAWSPNGRYLAVGGDNGTTDLIVYEWTGASFVQKDTKPLAPSEGWVAVNWSPDGRYLAVGGNNGSDDLIVYEWNGSALTERATVDFANHVYGCAWSPGGRYLAAGGVNGTDDLVVYAWNGLTLTQKAVESHGTAAYAVAWRPDGKYLAVAGESSDPNDVVVYGWNGLALTEKDNKDHGTRARSVAWSPDGRYLAVGGDKAPNDVVVYEFDGSLLITTTLAHHSGDTYSVSWSPDGKYLMIGGEHSSASLQVYDWDGVSLTQTYSQYHGSRAESAVWSPNEDSIAVGGVSAGNDLVVYNVSNATATYAPSCDTGFIIGDSSSGSAYDLDLFVLAGGTLKIEGTVLYDDV